MALTTLSEKLSALRTDRPDEWTMDELKRDAIKLEAERDELRAKLAESESEIKRLESAWHVETMSRKDRIIGNQEAENDPLREKLAADPSHSQKSAAIAEVVQINQDRYATVLSAPGFKLQRGDKLYTARCPSHESEGE